MEVARRKTRRLAVAGGDNMLMIGAAQNGPASHKPSERFVGSIDELVMYSRALSPEEISALADGIQPALSL